MYVKHNYCYMGKNIYRNIACKRIYIKEEKIRMINNNELIK